MSAADESGLEGSIYDTVGQASFEPLTEPVEDPEPWEMPEQPEAPAKAPEEPQQAEKKPEEPLPTFDERHKDDFVGLTYLGRLHHAFTMWGHKFVIKTLTTDELAQVALIVKPFEGTRAQNTVYQTATVAAAIVSVDGKPLVQPLGFGDDQGHLLAKHEYVMSQWMPPVREKVWEEVFNLETRVRTVLDEMGKVSG